MQIRKHLKRLLTSPKVSTIGILLGAFNLFGAMSPLLDLARWVRYLITVWKTLTRDFWTYIFSLINIKIYIWVPDVSTTALILAVIALSISINPRSRGRGYYFKILTSSQFHLIASIDPPPKIAPHMVGVLDEAVRRKKYLPKNKSNSDQLREQFPWAERSAKKEEYKLKQQCARLREYIISFLAFTETFDFDPPLDGPLTVNEGFIWKHLEWIQVTMATTLAVIVYAGYFEFGPSIGTHLIILFAIIAGFIFYYSIVQYIAINPVIFGARCARMLQALLVLVALNYFALYGEGFLSLMQSPPR